MLRVLLILLTLSLEVNAQNLVVADSKRASYPTGKKIHRFDTISQNSKIIIAKKGYLNLRMENHWVFHLKEGSYRIDSVVSIEMTKRAFQVHDSICNRLKEKRIFNCKFNYTYGIAPGSVSGHYITNGIKIVSPDSISGDSRRTNISTDTVTLRWKYPIQYSGNHFLLVSNLWGEYLALESTHVLYF